MKSYATYILNLTVVLSLSFLAFGCSGSSSSSPTSESTTSVSGSVLAGPASGTTVTVKTVAGTVVAGPVTTDTNGSYTVAIPSSALAGDLIFEASGGVFPDEATTTTGVTLTTLSTHIVAGTLTSGSNVTIDPSSTIVQKLVAGGMARAAADSAFNTTFGYTPDCTVKPAFAAMSSASSDTQRLAGVRAAAFSQLTKDLGLAPAKQFELIQALADDLSDGVLDGKKTGGTTVTTASGTALPADIGNKFAQSLMSFLTNSLNKSKLTTDKIGTLPFNRLALTSNYKVEYVPGTNAATQGKTSFKIKLTNVNNGTPATGKTISLMPVMHMAGMNHSAPVDTVTDNGDGTYSCTVYYLMASGPGMGVWELKVTIGGLGGETATFYPPVAMSMGSTTRITLKGVNDKIPAMTGGMATNRSYYIFNDGLNGMGPYTFKLFIAALDDSMMMRLPAVSVGSTLHDQASAAWTVNTMKVEVSTDGTTWTSAIDNGTGHWSVSGLTGLASGGTINTRVTVNGEQKTTDGSAVSGTNGYSAFIIVPGM